ncbi:unnamed protein product [Clonostachys chloroleuca]|uniref:Heterokaryon incompatibility domain-containing protein n=1 Tax=Clonostachys chloroleuca TaxID=1926264 RepID=A0AA35LY07_9HYPO|nr:unnamed protein product [Clonostachys chloroleuca]
MVSDSTYTYTAIAAPRNIRLIHLHPGSDSDPVSLSLATVALDSVPDYEAISYCWGQAADQRQVTCNSATLSITNSLFTGLVAFRRPNRPRILWADAICINQDDLVEKRDQVLLMPEIYSQAKRVLVWLGIADDPVYGRVPLSVVDSIQEALQMIPEFNPEDASGIVATIRALYEDSQRLSEQGKPNLLDHDWLPLGSLLSRPWFRRKWMIQEISLAKEVLVHVGNDVQFPWLNIAQLMFSIGVLNIDSAAGLQIGKAPNVPTHQRGRDGTSREPISGDGEAKKTFKGSSFSFNAALQCAAAIYMVQLFRHTGTLLDGVVVAQLFECTDPRDHVYSLLSLISTGPTIQPDYEASLGDVFRRFAKAMLVEGQSLKVLGLAPNKHAFYKPDAKEVEGLPSWVPDLRDIHSNVLTGSSVRPQAFFAGGKNKPILQISADERILSCSGRVVDSVEAFSTGLLDMVLDDMPELRANPAIFLETDDPLPERRQRRFARWLDGCYSLAFSHYYADRDVSNPQDHLMGSFARSMTCDIDLMRNRADRESISKFPQYMERIFDDVEKGNFDLEIKSSKMPPDLTNLGETVRSFAISLFCVTGNGRFGRIPHTSRAGDVVCVFVGAETPFIIRPTGRETYTMIGECYIDGIMDGEAMEGSSLPDGSLDTIDLE